jgi:hypothetical protein
VAKNHLHWSDIFRRVYKRQAGLIGEQLLRRVLPAFDDLETEAEQIANDEYARLGRMPAYDDSVDMGDLADVAQDAGIAHYEDFTSLRQGALNPVTAGLFHLWEQQRLQFYRREVLHPLEEDDRKLFGWKAMNARFVEYGVDVARLSSSKKINELRHVANVIKHTEGPSSDELLALRPDLFVHPLFRKEQGGRGHPAGDVRMPLMGDDLYVTEEDLAVYTNAVQDFWEEFASALEAADSSRPSK